MRQVLMALVLVAGCGAGSDQGNESGGTGAGRSGRDGGSVQITELAGLYEGGPPLRPHQMCVIEKAGEASFALVVWGTGMHSCSGSGRAVREGNTLRLSMAGDESCTMEAKINGTNATLPDNLPQGCAYYCGAQAKLGGASFTKKSSKVEDAMKAKDLVGEPLCGGLGSQ
jgi:hypothetical protein